MEIRLQAPKDLYASIAGGGRLPGSVQLITPKAQKSSLRSELLRLAGITSENDQCRKAEEGKKSLFSSNLALGESTDRIMTDSKPPTTKPAGAGKQGGLNAEIQSRIGHQLRAMYDDVVRQGVPDRFAELIRQLDAPETANSEIPKNDGRD